MKNNYFKQLFKRLLVCALVFTTLFSLSGCQKGSKFGCQKCSKLEGIWVRVSKSKVKAISDFDIERVNKIMTDYSKYYYYIYDVIFVDEDSYKYYVKLYDSRKLLYEGKEDTNKNNYYAGKLKETNYNNYELRYEDKDGKIVDKNPGKLKYINDNLIVIDGPQDEKNATTPRGGTYMKVTIEK